MNYLDYEPRVKIDEYEAQVRKYEETPIEEGKIIFYGSSGFTRWSEKHGHRNLEDDILAKDGSKICINHGFGGSCVEEQLYYYPRLVKAWKPKALVFGGFVNDTWRGYGTEEIIFMFNRLMDYARHDMPGIRLYICTIHPMAAHIGKPVSYWTHYHDYMEAYVKDYCARHDDCVLLDHVNSPVFYKDPADVGDWDKMRTDIFIEDGVHFTQEGYDLYREFFKEGLRDVL